ncbi:MAG: hypothetical protein AAGI46_09160 [Planctomycetota bacterium]
MKLDATRDRFARHRPPATAKAKPEPERPGDPPRAERVERQRLRIARDRDLWGRNGEGQLNLFE